MYVKINLHLLEVYYMGIFFLILITLIAAGVAVIGFHYNKTPLKIGGIAGALIMVFVGCALISNHQKEEIERLENVVSELKEEICPMQFKVLKSKNSEVQIEVKYIDLEGKETVKRQTYNLSGEEIHFDFTVIKLNEKNYLFFPKTIYSNTMAPEAGINLTASYSTGSYPAIYNKLEKFVKQNDSKNLKVYKEEISHLFSLVQTENVDMISEKFGNAVHNMKGITEFKKGYSYKIICHPHTGSIEIQKM